MNKKLKILLMILAINSCTSKQEAKNGDTYMTIVNYNDESTYHNEERYQRRTEELLSIDTLYIFFETEFKFDTINIKINHRKTRTLYLETDPSLGLANLDQYGDIKSIEKIEIKKNNGSSLIINLTDKKMNIWAVSFYSDTLIAERRKCLQRHE